MQPLSVDPLDDYIYTLKKVAVAKLFQQLALSPTVTPEVALQQGQQLQQLLNPNATPPKGEDIELKDIMKYNALMLQMMNQAEAFRKMGKTEEASKLEDRIMQMMQMQQNMMQTYLQGQQNLFQTALSVKKETEQEYKEQLGGLGQKLEEIKEYTEQQPKGKLKETIKFNRNLKVIIKEILVLSYIINTITDNNVLFKLITWTSVETVENYLKELQKYIIRNGGRQGYRRAILKRIFQTLTSP